MAIDGEVEIIAAGGAFIVSSGLNHGPGAGCRPHRRQFYAAPPRFPDLTDSADGATRCTS